MRTTRTKLNSNRLTRISRTVMAFTAILPILEGVSMAETKHNVVVAMTKAEDLEIRAGKAFDSAAKTLGPLVNATELDTVRKQVIAVVTGREVTRKLEKSEVDPITQEVTTEESGTIRECNFTIPSPRAKKFADTLKTELKKAAPDVEVDFDGQIVTVTNNAKITQKFAFDGD